LPNPVSGARAQPDALAAHARLVCREQQPDGHEDQRFGRHVVDDLGSRALVGKRQGQCCDHGRQVKKRASRWVGCARAQPQDEEVLVGRRPAGGEVVESGDARDARVGDDQQVVEARAPPCHSHGRAQAAQSERNGDGPAHGADLLVDRLEREKAEREQPAEPEQAGLEAARRVEVGARIGVRIALEHRTHPVGDRLPWQRHSDLHRQIWRIP
jgi:hypothetical protein